MKPNLEDIIENETEFEVEKRDEWSLFLKNWRSFCGTHESSPMNKRLNIRLIEAPLSDMWRMSFICALLNTCIRSNQNNLVRYKFLYKCMDLKNVKNLNWNKFVLTSCLISATQEWKAKKDGYFTGPFPFLQICYFDRVKRQLKEEPRRIPLISVWNEERIKNRIAIEELHGFGKGEILCLIEEDKTVGRACIYLLSINNFHSLQGSFYNRCTIFPCIYLLSKQEQSNLSKCKISITI
ncbi:uncharacterized protein LOC110689350 isoform X1 [Chenopodium quinoa]|uniref:uncharacterized protein LOC110689350 isoform X1 n=1 Tax=Chenopodium quinoa TaxID=63459 RepID=UPI000B786F87|nr:uncharacterized protein LOC110689350 isoform X1 [Chenopodium quinoa]XP_021721821.1 uncharacterized protein LOC110689350 isoform X1 [Chenopodium quinoa]